MSIHIASATITSTAPASAFFDRWADMETWPEWNTDTEWVRLDGPFAQGATGTLKPQGGPKVRFVVDELTEDRFLDVSRLLGARLSFDHRVTRLEDGTRVEVTVSLDGPLARVWNMILGKDLAASLQPDLDRLDAAASATAA
ncbi:MAG: SRPBCC family protein [Marmoricola sp.]